MTFTSEGETLRGEVHLPSSAPEGTRLPAVVVTGSWTTVRQQMPALYARRLAERGYLALAFDFRGYGDSTGSPRDLESPVQKAADIHQAVTFLTGHPQADPDRIGALALCAGAGYAAVNAAGDDRVRSLALVAPWLHDATLVEALYGGPEGVAQLMKTGQDAERHWRQTGEVTYVPAVSATDPDAAMYGPFDYYLNPERGAIPQWGNRFAVMAWPGWLTFDPIAVAPKIHTPTLLVHSEEAAIPDGARRFHDALAGPKALVWTSGTQLDFYDQEPHVTTAVDAAVDHFTATL
ncbi:alpha/beta hydrolase [Nonomuraea sp. NEAU-A123]|uniref:alpha/beta hydrolase n=1 Tax=Nonomuraea sp. NEAU-A123 TaxID=2839649 RepID=UPI001BE41E1A|nr:alpha/beta hydrolase [Nonomuraea sp. NEAU-A123]MBT2224358.1 alpha/beta hydrolase [Nonomuraea sp. NEAU-A123]